MYLYNIHSYSLRIVCLLFIFIPVVVVISLVCSGFPPSRCGPFLAFPPWPWILYSQIPGNAEGWGGRRSWRSSAFYLHRAEAEREGLLQRQREGLLWGRLPGEQRFINLDKQNAHTLAHAWAHTRTRMHGDTRTHANAHAQAHTLSHTNTYMHTGETLSLWTLVVTPAELQTAGSTQRVV